jgi:signal transduction histidine kinase
MRRIRELNLLIGFTFLLVLIGSIGLIGIFQIRQLTSTIQRLGRHNLVIQDAILQMRVANSLWVSGIRNFVFWKTAKVLESLPAALDYSSTQTQAAERFERYLTIYSSYAESTEQKEWIKRLKESEAQLRTMGEQIIVLLSRSDVNTQEVTRLVMSFENRFYKIDDFLNDPLGRYNLDEVAEQLTRASAYKTQAILLLSICSVLSILTGGSIAFFVYRSRKVEQQKKEILLGQLMNTEEDERRNLSFQIHNEMGQDLSALKIYLGLIEKNLPQPPSGELSENVRQSKSLLANLIEKSHNIAYFLRPSSLDEAGIVATVEALILQYQRTTGIKFNFQKPKLDLKLSPQYNLILYRVVQEAITNIVKYANAKTVDILLSGKPGLVQLDIKDDGLGFDYNKLLEQGPRDKLGLLGLRERVELLGGAMRINTAPGKGTRITVQLNI